MKNIVLVFILLTSSLCFAKKTKWQKHYGLVLKDIKSVEKIKNRDLPLRVRLFELYGEKLQLLLQKENEYRIRFLNTGKGKALNAVLRKQKMTLTRLDGIAAKIERLTDNKAILAKINYYRSLNYMLVKNNKLFYKYIKQAEKLNSNKELGNEINFKLADYYYNEKKFSNSIVYYNKILAYKKDEWATKHYYNLAWSHLKLEEYEPALENIKLAYSYEQKKGSFKIGDQLVSGILLFYAYSKKTELGLKYMKSQGLISFDNLLLYLDYVFKSGDKKSISIIIESIFSKKRSLDQEFQIAEKLIFIYRNLKKFESIQRYLVRFNETIKKQKLQVNKESLSKLVETLKNYTGFLQKGITNSEVLGAKKQIRYVRYIAYNFDTLKAIDPKNQLEYMYYKGETYFTVGSFRNAIVTYLNALRVARKNKTKSQFIKKSFDSLFKVIEEEGRAQSKILVSTFTTYLYFYPNKYKANEIYKRLINLYRATGKDRELFATLRKYNKYYPKEIVEQRVFYGGLVDKFVAKKDLKAIVSLKKFIEKGFLGYGKNESIKLKKIISEIYFFKYEELASKGEYKKAIAGFYELYQNVGLNYDLRVDSLRKKMFYEHKSYDYVGLGASLVLAATFYKEEYAKKFNQENMYYMESICVGDEIDACIQSYESIKKNKYFVISKNINSLYFRLKLSFDSKDIKRLPVDPVLNNYLFKILLVEDREFKSQLFLDFYKDKAKREIIEAEFERRVLQLFYSTLSITKTTSYIESISIDNVKNRHLKYLRDVEKTLSGARISLPAAPKVAELNEDMFRRLGSEVMKDAQNNTEYIQAAIKQVHANYLPFVLSKLIQRLEKSTDRFKKFIPISKNPELEKAMNEEISNIHKYFDNQIVEYRNLYYRSLSATIIGSGVRIYNNDIIKAQQRPSLGDLKLWTSY